MAKSIVKSELHIRTDNFQSWSQNYIFFAKRGVRTTYSWSQSYIFACGKLRFVESELHICLWKIFIRGVRTTYLNHYFWNVKSELHISWSQNYIFRGVKTTYSWSQNYIFGWICRSLWKTFPFVVLWFSGNAIFCGFG